ncbi:hypothetical protein D932_02494 [Enterococcus casseliflavus 14-MB-W-14]|nr:hypothetical protein D932_02494 [Enterococcus casseliflavus 14-MB-W-14]
MRNKRRSKTIKDILWSSFLSTYQQEANLRIRETCQRFCRQRLTEETQWASLAKDSCF